MLPQIIRVIEFPDYKWLFIYKHLKKKIYGVTFMHCGASLGKKNVNKAHY